MAWVAELVDARDLKSLDTWYRVGSTPTLGTMITKGYKSAFRFVTFSFGGIVSKSSNFGLDPFYRLDARSQTFWAVTGVTHDHRGGFPSSQLPRLIEIDPVWYQLRRERNSSHDTSLLMISPSSSPSGKCYQKRPVTAPGVLAAIKDMMPPLCIKISITGLFRKSVVKPLLLCLGGD